MRERKEILIDLIQLNGNLTELKNELSEYPWDLAEPILMIRKEDLAMIFDRAAQGAITFRELGNWANAIESRDDLDFENPELHEIIFDIANAEINDRIDQHKLARLIQYLSER